MAQMVESGTMTREEAAQQRQQQQAYEMVMRGIQMYEQNPDMFSNDQVRSLMEGAQAMGVNWSPNFSGSRAIKKGLYELGEGLTFGLLPDSLDPGAFTPGEQIAGGLGGLLGLAAPIGVGGLAARGAARGARALAGGLREGALAERVAGRFGMGPRALTREAANLPLALKNVSTGAVSGMSRARALAAAAKRNAEIAKSLARRAELAGAAGKNASKVATQAENIATSMENMLRSNRVKYLASRFADSRFGRLGVGLGTFAMTNRMFDETNEGM